MTGYRVHIERLVLEGVPFDAKEVDALRVAIERTLVDVGGAGADSHDAESRAQRETGTAPADMSRAAGLGREAALAIHRTVTR